MSIKSFVLVVVVIACSGCSGGPRFAECLPADGYHNILEVSGDFGAPLNCQMRPDFAIDVVMKVPEDVTLELDGKPWQPIEGGAHRLDVSAALLALPAGDLRADGVAYTIPVTVTRAGEAPVVKTIAIQGSQPLWRDLYARVAEGRTLGPGAGTRATPPTIVMPKGMFDVRLMGKPARIGDVDYVALVEDSEGAPKTCSGYEDFKTKRFFDVKFVPVTTDVVVYDARTAREVTRKRFDSGLSAECPEVATEGTQHVRAKPEDIDAWLEGWRASPEAARD